MELSKFEDPYNSKIQMLTSAGYEAKEELPMGQLWWFRGHRIGRLHVAMDHCHARQVEIVKACVFLMAEGYSITAPESVGAIEVARMLVTALAYASGGLIGIAAGHFLGLPQAVVVIFIGGLAWFQK